MAIAHRTLMHVRVTMTLSSGEEKEVCSGEFHGVLEVHQTRFEPDCMTVPVLDEGGSFRLNNDDAFYMNGILRERTRD